MRLIIAGSRGIDKYRAFYEALNFGINYDDLETDLFYMGIDEPIDEFVTGKCFEGADQVPYMLFKIAKQVSDPYTTIKEFPADWNRHGKAAGPIRNKEMAEYADALLLIWDGKSKGSANMKKEMEKLGKPVHEVLICSN